MQRRLQPKLKTLVGKSCNLDSTRVFFCMAYFSNGSEGHAFDDQCGRCKFGKSPCPIALIQIFYNYDQLKDTTGTARKIMDTLVNDSGECAVYEMAKTDFAIDSNQLDLF